MEKLVIDKAIIEVTRRCNMTCEHCLRGDVEKVNMSRLYLETFFSKVQSVNDLTITGGEPSIAVPQIRTLIDVIQRHKVGVGTFYLVTNGKVVTREFIQAVFDLYMLCDDMAEGETYGGLALSTDSFHEDISRHNISQLKVFSFFHERGDIDRKWVISEGRGYYNFGNPCHATPDSYTIEDGVIQEGNVYLNCEGNIIAGCDFSYESQREPENIVCHVKDMSAEVFEDFNSREEREAT